MATGQISATSQTNWHVVLERMSIEEKKTLFLNSKFAKIMHHKLSKKFIISMKDCVGFRCSMSGSKNIRTEVKVDSVKG